MSKVVETLKALGCGKSVESNYVREILEVVLERRKFEPGIYEIVAQRTGRSVGAVRKGVSRITPILWKNFIAMNGMEGAEYPGPLDTLHEITFYMTDKDIL